MSARADRYTFYYDSTSTAAARITAALNDEGSLYVHPQHWVHTTMPTIFPVDATTGRVDVTMRQAE
eukprot:2544846-Pleurochrysis_carterae.AAC.1